MVSEAAYQNLLRSCTSAVLHKRPWKCSRASTVHKISSWCPIMFWNTLWSQKPTPFWSAAALRCHIQCNNATRNTRLCLYHCINKAVWKIITKVQALLLFRNPEVIKADWLVRKDQIVTVTADSTTLNGCNGNKPSLADFLLVPIVQFPHSTEQTLAYCRILRTFLNLGLSRLVPFAQVWTNSYWLLESQGLSVHYFLLTHWFNFRKISGEWTEKELQQARELSSQLIQHLRHKWASENRNSSYLVSYCNMLKKQNQQQQNPPQPKQTPITNQKTPKIHKKFEEETKSRTAAQERLSSLVSRVLGSKLKVWPEQKHRETNSLQRRSVFSRPQYNTTAVGTAAHLH